MSFEKMINYERQLSITWNSGHSQKANPSSDSSSRLPSTGRAKIVEAILDEASATSYSGVYEGFYIDFEAKETRQKMLSR